MLLGVVSGGAVGASVELEGGGAVEVELSLRVVEGVGGVVVVGVGGTVGVVVLELSGRVVGVGGAVGVVVLVELSCPNTAPLKATITRERIRTDFMAGALDILFFRRT